MVPAAAIVERVMSDPPITTAQLGLLRRGVTGNLEDTRELLGRDPQPFTADACRISLAGLAKPLFGVSIRPPLRPQAFLGVLLALVLIVVCLRLAA